MTGRLWGQMLTLTRHNAASLTRSEIPTAVGVYVWFREDSPIYSGRAVGNEGIKLRVWDNHVKTGPDLSRSSFRRNVCEYLGIADTSISRQRPTRLTPEEVAPVNAWIRECKVAWRTFDTEDREADVKAASDFEADLHTEWLPPLSKK